MADRLSFPPRLISAVSIVLLQLAMARPEDASPCIRTESSFLLHSRPAEMWGR